jgi:Raf kinase inhibitor-like YbhB/YbcL family protein
MKLKNVALAASLFAAGILLASKNAWSFELKSPDLADGNSIANPFVYKGFGCEGGNLSPALSWSDPPEGTKGYALLVHDPDAPTGGAGFWHWVVVNIPATTTSLPQGVAKDGKGLPEGASQVSTDFGEPGYGGPCPPKGDTPHRYHFTIYALKTDKLELPLKATASLAGFLVNANSLGKATLTGVYGR